jgi:endonuclease/exonuclease/phosphatase family metal-dependent hydrolase
MQEVVDGGADHRSAAAREERPELVREPPLAGCVGAVDRHAERMWPPDARDQVGERREDGESSGHGAWLVSGAVLVRSWNLFHGNTVPAQRRDELARMVRLIAEDEPEVVCVQEVPVWALERLGEWSGMQVFGEVAARPSFGPLPSTAGIGRVVTDLNHGLFRSIFTGQANAILVAPWLRAESRGGLVLNSLRFRRVQARWLELPLLARLAWAKERRVAHAVRLRLRDGRGVLVANLHATAYPPDGRLAAAEILRATVFADALALPDDVAVLAGDFNVFAGSKVLKTLTGEEWGFAGPGLGPRIDHVLVRGAEAGPIVVWGDERRRVDGRLLSDHAPVEVVVE